MEIGDIFYCYRGLKHVIVNKFEDLETEFLVCRFWSPKGYYAHCVEWKKEFERDFKNNRKFKSRYLYNKYKNS